MHRPSRLGTNIVIGQKLIQNLKNATFEGILPMMGSCLPQIGGQLKRRLVKDASKLLFSHAR